MYNKQITEKLGVTMVGDQMYSEAWIETPYATYYGEGETPREAKYIATTKYENNVIEQLGLVLNINTQEGWVEAALYDHESEQVILRSSEYFSDDIVKAIAVAVKRLYVQAYNDELL